MTLSPYQKIKRAALNQTSVKLTATEAWQLYNGDDAFRQVADADDGWQSNYPVVGGTYEQQSARHGAPMTNAQAARTGALKSSPTTFLGGVPAGVKEVGDAQG